jgi:hypothetical protein
VDVRQDYLPQRITDVIFPTKPYASIIKKLFAETILSIDESVFLA